MANKIILEYLRINRGNYRLGDLKKKILSSGYTQKDVNEALVQLNAESKGNAPSVSKTIGQINKTNIAEKIPVQPKQVARELIVQEPKPKKSKKWLLIILGIIFLVLIGIGISVWIFFDEIKALFV